MKAKRRPQLSRTTKELLRHLSDGYTATYTMIVNGLSRVESPEHAAYMRGRADVYNLVAVELLALCDKPIEADPTD